MDRHPDDLRLLSRRWNQRRAVLDPKLQTGMLQQRALSSAQEATRQRSAHLLRSQDRERASLQHSTQFPEVLKGMLMKENAEMYQQDDERYIVGRNNNFAAAKIY